MINNDPFWPKHAFSFKGGGGTVDQIVPQATPPPVAELRDKSRSRRAAQIQNRRRRGLLSTILASDSAQNTGGQNVLG